MDKRILGLLPEPLQRAVVEIEAVSRVEVDVKTSPAGWSQSNLETVSSSGYVIKTNPSRSIQLQFAGDNIPIQDLVHEILHVARLVLYAMPRLTMLAPQSQAEAVEGQKIIALENAIEHLWVLSEEQKYGSDLDVIRLRSSGPADTSTDVATRRFNLLLESLVVFVLPASEKLVREMYDRAAAEGEADRIESFLADVGAVFRSDPSRVPATKFRAVAAGMLVEWEKMTNPTPEVKKLAHLKMYVLVIVLHYLPNGFVSPRYLSFYAPGLTAPVWDIEQVKWPQGSPWRK